MYLVIVFSIIEMPCIHPNILYNIFSSRFKMRPLMFLLKLAWDCRYRLPLLITVGFMILDVRMQLDINVQTRRVHRHHHHHEPDEDHSSEDTATDSDSVG